MTKFPMVSNRNRFAGTGSLRLIYPWSKVIGISLFGGSGAGF